MMDMQAELNRLQYENFLLQDQLRCANRKTGAALRKAEKFKREIADMRQEGREQLIDCLQQELDRVRGMMNASTRDNRKLLADVNWAYAQLRDRPTVTITKAPAYHVCGPVLSKQGHYHFKYHHGEEEVVAEVWVRPWERTRPYSKGRNRKRDLRDKLVMREALDPRTDITMDEVYDQIAWSQFWSGDEDAWAGATDYDVTPPDPYVEDWWYEEDYCDPWEDPA